VQEAGDSRSPGRYEKALSAFRLLPLFIGVISITSAVGQTARTACDSVNIIFKNGSASEIMLVHAVIKSKEVAFKNVKAGAQTPSFKICASDPELFRFSVFKDDPEDKDSIEPMDYFEQVSEEKLISGTYQYTIAYDKSGLLKISLKKL
jgi:hypothetical protein